MTPVYSGFSLDSTYVVGLKVRLIVFNTTLNNISFILWQSV
jgi:hypothetical protein